MWTSGRASRAAPLAAATASSSSACLHGTALRRSTVSTALAHCDAPCARPPQATVGLISGHAYAVLDTVEIFGSELVRNLCAQMPLCSAQCAFLALPENEEVERREGKLSGADMCHGVRLIAQRRSSSSATRGVHVKCDSSLLRLCLTTRWAQTFGACLTRCAVRSPPLQWTGDWSDGDTKCWNQAVRAPADPILSPLRCPPLPDWSLLRGIAHPVLRALPLLPLISLSTGQERARPREGGRGRPEEAGERAQEGEG